MMSEPCFVYPRTHEGPELAVPGHQRVWQHRPVAALLPGQPVTWRFSDLAVSPGQTLWVRLIPALDVRVPQILSARTAAGKLLSRRSIGLPTEFEPLDLPLPPEMAGDLAASGLQLTLEGDAPLWIHLQAGHPAARGIPLEVLSSSLVLQPVGIDPVARRAAFERRLCSLGAVAELGWISGCVQDGLWALWQRARAQEPARGERAPQFAAGLARLMDAFFTPTGVSYQSPRSEPIDDYLNNVEGGLPWAVLARLQPEHPAIEIALRFFRERQQENHRDHFTCEGNYTFTYPMLVIGLQRGMDALVQAAWENYRLWQTQLRQPEGIYLRANAAGRTYRNWARAWCWYLLGQVRALQAAAEAGAHLPADRLEDVRQVVAAAIALQRADGLWSNFLDESGQMPDTAGSAGIAAAMAEAARAGWLQGDLAEAAGQAAGRCWASLLDHLTADGYLMGVAPSNKAEGGTSLQRQPERSMQQFGLGLMASLAAALEA